mmetsp:Transcript_15520/g.50869  ORF Transcript_15520/g.50869 Transcript_15520/m.50869 type:complete len:650 (+) Transcript_15520:144-2093(+)|eukprot:CAMPEP_0118901320 /NCGR_PEP_ID=MMETSP1166-20130328/7075_1 /TAXON_ID=1104430 /ORGANISM="Chrysoreinhardia sp, Strain CCMP3193" /LENGTH=649 /DNA_ID=CAMNT_0006840491 /DNA_START=58 /DNA_END=2007 /DNA_ORIENTATION=-
MTTEFIIKALPWPLSSLFNSAMRAARCFLFTTTALVPRRGVAFLSTKAPGRKGALHAEVASYFVKLPETAKKYLSERGIVEAAPIQAACWAREDDSFCVHAPTGSGKTLATLLPSLTATLWEDEDDSRDDSNEPPSSTSSRPALLICAPTRELATQHAAVVRGLIERPGDCCVVTTSTTGNPETIDAAAEKVASARVVVATPKELTTVMEADESLYREAFAARVRAVVLDELDLLMPARKFAGKERPSRWQSEGLYPAEALVRILARRAPTLRVYAASATLDRVAKRKLEKHLKASKSFRAKLPLPIVRPALLDVDDASSTAAAAEDDDEGDLSFPAGDGDGDGDGDDSSASEEASSERASEERVVGGETSSSSAISLTTKSRRQNAARSTTRTTLVPRAIEHRYVEVRRGVDDEAFVKVLRRAIAARRPRRAVVFLCSESGLKLRQVEAKLKQAGMPPHVLGDVLFSQSARAKKRRFHKTGSFSIDKSRSEAIGTRDAVAKKGAAKLDVALGIASRDHPCLVLTDEAVARGLHLDGVDSVFIVGRPANADNYLHLAGRTGRLSSGAADLDDLAPPTVITIADVNTLNLVRGWLAVLATTDLVELPITATETATPPKIKKKNHAAPQQQTATRRIAASIQQKRTSSSSP